MDSKYRRVPDRLTLDGIIDKVVGFSSGKGQVSVNVSAYWQGSTRWYRNRIGSSSNRFDYWLAISRFIDGGVGSVRLNQIDDHSISEAVKFSEWKAGLGRGHQMPEDFTLSDVGYTDPEANVWSDATVEYDFIDSGKIVRATCNRAEEMGLVTGGYIECTGVAIARGGTARDRKFAELTKSRCSITTRNPAGLGAGWAGVTDIDFSKVDTEQIANTTLEKCIASINPVRIEPGRYNAILEPQAVADLIGQFLFANSIVMNRERAESPGSHGGHPFYLGYDPLTGLHRSKLGLKVFDDRVNVWHDPLDPDLGVIGYSNQNVGIKRISYVENGILKNLPYSKLYAANRLEIQDNNVHRGSFRMKGENISLEEMVASTRRGVWITRLSGGGLSDASSMVATGLTRGGLWLIENGKVKHAIRNFRTLESPFFILNNIEQIGRAVKVYADDIALGLRVNELAMFSTHNFAPQYIVPALKVRDFSFAASIDAV